VFLEGSAYMWDYTKNTMYSDRITSILGALEETFYGNKTISETACEPTNCDSDQQSFKAYVARVLTHTIPLYNASYGTIRTLLEPSAEGAASSCTGGYDGMTCGMDWTKGSWDGLYSVGMQLSALETVLGLLATNSSTPYTPH